MVLGHRLLVLTVKPARLLRLALHPEDIGITQVIFRLPFAVISPCQLLVIDICPVRIVHHTITLSQHKSRMVFHQLVIFDLIQRFLIVFRSLEILQVAEVGQRLLHLLMLRVRRAAEQDHYQDQRPYYSYSVFHSVAIG